ncbi:MAG TPA: PPK2 family polyphosphate kinase [Rubricoccaceae bacterium]|nr:PPK2 family polyphosphate kinase [Rubricoccaceae bacterium]
MRLDLDRYRVHPGQPVRLADFDPADTQGMDADDGKDDAKELFEAHVEAMDALQERLYAEGQQSLLVVLQAMDGGGKDSTIRSVFGPLDPQGVRVAPFKAPTEEELAHDFLWRVHAQAPRKGELVVFNRSHYEDVLIVRVHGWAPPGVIERRYDHINAFERLLLDSHTRIVKLYLHVSKAYQLERMRRRLERPDKHWKFNPGDLKERERWDDYMRAFEIAFERCSTEQAPWYVVPAEKRWFRDLVVAQLLRETLEAMDPLYPAPDFNPAEFPPDALV